jgi:hypothetical protein
MNKVVARMQVWNVHKDKTADGVQMSESVTMHPVYSSDPASPNYSFSQATPSGQVQMFITNPDAFGFFELHHEYDIHFAKTAKAAPAAG